MSIEKRYHSNDPLKVMGRILREVFDALLLIVLLIAIAFLVYYLQIPQEERLPISDLIPWGTKTPGITNTVTPSRTLISKPSASQTRMSTVTPRPSATSSLKATLTPRLISTAPPAPPSAAQLPVDAEISDGIEQGNRIVQAIEAYTGAKGFYPAALDELVPQYMPALPVTKTGQVFFYRVFERTTVMAPEIYWVSFKVVSQTNVTCTYYRRLQYWDCNFSSP